MPKRTVNQWHYIVESIHDYNVLLDTREIFIHGCLDEIDDSGVDHIMANKFVKNMRLLETLPAADKPIIIHQHSVGGDWSSGMMMFDTIVSCRCPILFIYHGEACSMGSIIPQACAVHKNAYRVIMPNVLFMVHDGTTGIDTNFTRKKTKSWAAIEEKLDKQMMEIYCRACANGEFFKNFEGNVKIKQYIREQLDKSEDWWLNARETVFYGFADAVMGDEGYESIDDILQNWE